MSHTPDAARALVARALNLPLEQVPPDGDVETIAGWDSLNHFAVIAELEKLARRKLTALEIAGLRSLQDVAALLRS